MTPAEIRALITKLRDPTSNSWDGTPAMTATPFAADALDLLLPIVEELAAPADVSTEDRYCDHYDGLAARAREALK